MKRWKQSDLNELIDPRSVTISSRRFYNHIDKDAFKAQDLSGLDFSKIICNEFNFESSDLSGAIFKQSHLSDVSFDHANLSGSNFLECYFAYTSFDGADLSRANLLRSNIEDAYFSNETNLYRTMLPNTLIPFVYKKNDKYVSDYFFQFCLMNNGEEQWYLRKNYYNYASSFSEIESPDLLHIMVKHIDLFDLNNSGLPIKSKDFIKYIRPLLAKNNSVWL